MRYLLAAFFFLIYVGDDVGLAISLAPGLSFKNLLLYVVLTGIAINAAVARNRKLEMMGVLIMFPLLILYALVTWVILTFIIQDPEYQAKGAFIALKNGFVDQFLTFLIFFYGVLALKDAVWLLRAILWMVLLGNLITVVDTMNIPDLGLLPNPRKAGRFEGFQGMPNEYGLFLALFLPACTVLFLELRKMLRLLAGIGIFASALALILTGSRGAYVGLLGGAVFAAFYLRRYVPAQTVVRATATAVLFCTVVITTTYATGYADLFMDRFSGIEGTAHVATSGRSSIWSNAIDSMLENPLSFVSGYGFYSYDSARSFRLATHNTYLWYLYNLGAVGLFLFLAIVARVLSTARSAIPEASDRQRRHFMALVFGLIGFLVATFFSDYHEVGYLLWAYVGVLMRMAMLLRERAPAPERAAEVLQAGEDATAQPGAPAWLARDLGSARR